MENNGVTKGKVFLSAQVCIYAMLLGMLISIVSCIFIIKNISDKNSEDDTTAITAIVNDQITKDFMQPIAIAQNLSASSKILDGLKNSEYTSVELEAKDIIDELVSIQKNFGYEMVYVVPAYSKEYYTYKGMFTFRDEGKKHYEAWYEVFKNSGKTMRLMLM